MRSSWYQKFYWYPVDIDNYDSNINFKTPNAHNT